MRFAAIVMAAMLLAQQGPDRPTFRSGVDLVDVAVVVRDRDGNTVRDLTAADFVITEKGVQQTVATFARVSIPIVKPDPTTPLVGVPADVSSNESAADGRIFVLVLDALHVAPASVGGVQRFARQFVAQHVGPSDLVAVLSPGGLAAATQDFTQDKGRLLRAIDSFTGNKLRPATVLIDEERRALLIPLHDGKDPDDGERANRAYALSSTLQALAGHLARVERRRKTLLLFSEGLDYNLMDLFGKVQRYSGDVMHAMNRAIGALMRTNVSLYTIDPRMLTGSDGAGNDPRPHEMPQVDLATATLDAEYKSSIASLRHLAESTGGFAFVDSNDLGGAFDRIVRESSDYYVVGYSPTNPPKPGEFRELSVTVARPGVTVVARRGYTTAAPAPTFASNAPSAAPEPSLPPQITGRRPAMPMPTTPEPRVAAPKGVASELATLLASPLAAPGLKIRVHAAPFRGSGGRAAVQVVIEVLGSSLTFAERGGRFEEKVELASATVDDRGRAANGRATTIDLKLTPEEHARVKTTGLRWISQLDLDPGRYQLRLAARALGTGTSGLVTTDVVVARYDDGISLSAVTLTSLPAVLMVTRGEGRVTLETPPTATRTFVAGDRIVAGLEVYAPRERGDVQVRASVVSADGTVFLDRVERAGEKPRQRYASVEFAIPTQGMPPGRYTLRVAAVGTATERLVPFDIVRNAR